MSFEAEEIEGLQHLLAETQNKLDRLSVAASNMNTQLNRRVYPLGVSQEFIMRHEELKDALRFAGHYTP